MDELVLKRINNAIKQFDHRPINTKYLTTFIFPKDPLVTQKNVEKYLLSKEFVKISDNYMFYFEDLIEYCEKNEINNINKFKSNIFIDFGVSNITLTDDDLSLILNNKRIQRRTFPFTYPVEEDLDNKIVVKTLSRTYVIRNRGELIKFGLANTYISFDLLKEYCMLFPKESQFEIRYLLDDRDIKLTSDKLYFESHTAKKLDRVAETIKKISYDFECEDLNIKDSRINRYANTGMFLNKLGCFNVSDIKIFFIQLAIDNKIVFDKKDFLSRYGYIIYEKMHYLKIIADKSSKIIVKPIAWLIVDQINKDKYYLGKNLQGILNYYRDEYFFNRFSKQIKELLLENEEINTLSSFLKMVNASKKFSVQDIMDYCIKNNIQDQFISIFLGDRPSNGIKPLKNKTDVCFNCSLLNKCIGENVKNKNDIYISDILLKYRNVYSKRCLNEIRKSGEINMLEGKSVYLKFLVSYNMVVKIKPLLIQLKLLGKTPILYKNSGKYCPRKDIWRTSI